MKQFIFQTIIQRNHIIIQNDLYPNMSIFYFTQNNCEIYDFNSNRSQSVLIF